MKTMTLQIPEELNEEDVALFTAVQLYQHDKLTVGQAAELAGISKRAFIESLGKFKIPVLSESVEELREDVVSLKKFLNDNR